MSPGEHLSVDSPTSSVTAVNASTLPDVEVQPALDYSTDDTTIGAPVEKVRIYLLSPCNGNRASRWSSVGQPLGSRSNTTICGDAESRTTTRIRDILRARRRLEFRWFHRAVSVSLDYRSYVFARCGSLQANNAYCSLIRGPLSSRAAFLHRTRELLPRTVWRGGRVS